MLKGQFDWDSPTVEVLSSQVTLDLCQVYSRR